MSDEELIEEFESRLVFLMARDGVPMRIPARELTIDDLDMSVIADMVGHRFTGFSYHMRISAVDDDGVAFSRLYVEREIKEESYDLEKIRKHIVTLRRAMMLEDLANVRDGAD